MGGRVAGATRRDGSSSRRAAVAAATSATARSTASSLRAETAESPATFRTYWRAAALTSSDVAGGSSPRRTVMLRHMCEGYDAGGTVSEAAPLDAPVKVDLVSQVYQRAEHARR